MVQEKMLSIDISYVYEGHMEIGKKQAQTGAYLEANG